ncbi:SRPBCC domain-containing protein [Streptomyces sp. NBC_00683]|uniref:SRPBCC domain-containing protein n=1 Tax=Streptomyces sp. NBC_00683 TaxID=2903670 RepID=UPI002E327283|nr:SRPBCC domain-containing protein [Streptomyces sp. NBC_00683]
MEHEVFVPVPAASLRRTLGDPARVARCVPGLQQDADASAGPLTGRLKIRIDGHTITYRGALTLTGRGDDAFLVSGEGVEARGAGSAKLSLTVGLTETDGGTTVAFSGSASGEGRIVELEEAAALAAAQRLLDRFTQQLVTESLAARDAQETAPGAVPEPGRASGDDRASADAEPSGDDGASGGGARSGSGSGEPGRSTDSASDEPGAADSTPDDASKPEPSASEPSEASASGEVRDKGSVFDAPVPPPSLDPAAELEFTVPDGPPAEAAHARRTMIGRSTEEVDHAPPRGRYAPVPSQDDMTAGVTLRWIAPAAALAIASAVVVGRALRRRR